jgi:hypothetical protein
MLFIPLKAANKGYFGTGANLMDALEWALARTRLAAPAAKAIVYAVPMAIAAGLIPLFARRKSTIAWEAQVALLAVLSLALFKHHNYDGVFLLFPMAYFLRHLRQIPARWGVALICYPWYGDVLFRATRKIPAWSVAIELAFLIAIGMIVVRVLPSNPTEQRIADPPSDNSNVS